MHPIQHETQPAQPNASAKGLREDPVSKHFNLHCFLFAIFAGVLMVRGQIASYCLNTACRGFALSVAEVMLIFFSSQFAEFVHVLECVVITALLHLNSFNFSQP